jgi:hypothetical protein
VPWTLGHSTLSRPTIFEELDTVRWTRPPSPHNMLVNLQEGWLIHRLVLVENRQRVGVNVSSIPKPNAIVGTSS